MKTLYFKTLHPSPIGFPDPAKDRIRMIAVHTTDTIILKGDEKQMISKFVEIFKNFDPDRIIGFRQDSDDFPYLMERAKKYGLSVNIGRKGEKIKQTGKYFRGIILKRALIPGRENIDLFSIAWRDFPSLPTKEIDELAEAIGIEGFKVVPDFKLHRMNDERLEKYLREYIETLLKIAEELIPFQESLSEITDIPIEDQTRMTIGEIVDTIVTREMKKRGINSIRIGGRGKYEGGYVYLKAPGVYEKVVYLDFQSMYPNIIRIWNISPETVDSGSGEIVEIEGVKHTVIKDKKGVIPSLIENFLNRRMELRKILRERYDKKIDAEQKALKVLANAMYGYMGWNSATYYNRNAAELIAALARHYIKSVKNIIEKHKGEVIYIDTDGVQFINGDVDVILDAINSAYPLNIKIERIAERAVFWAKKKYAHLENDTVSAVGIEYIRRDYPPIMKEAQKLAVKHLLMNEKDKAKAIREDFRSRIKNRDFEIEDIAIVEQLTKKPEEYEKPTKASVAASILAKNYQINIHRGMYLKVVIVKGSGGPTYRARPMELASIEELDIEYYLKMYDDLMKRTFEPFHTRIRKVWF